MTAIKACLPCEVLISKHTPHGKNKNCVEPPSVKLNCTIFQLEIVPLMPFAQKHSTLCTKQFFSLLLPQLDYEAPLPEMQKSGGHL